MSIILTLYIAGMPLAAAFLLYSLVGIGEEDWSELATLPGLAALTVFVLPWPLFLAISVYDVWRDK